MFTIFTNFKNKLNRSLIEKKIDEKKQQNKKMSGSRLNDLQGMTNGFCLVLRSYYNLQYKNVKHIQKSFLANDLNYTRLELENKISEAMGKNPSENLQKLAKKTETFFRQTNHIFSQSNVLNRTGFFTPKRGFHTLYRQQIRYSSTTTAAPPNITTSDNTTKTNTQTPLRVNATPKFKQNLNKFAKENKVPSNRVSRLINFGSLAAGLGAGAISEWTKRTLGGGQNSAQSKNDLSVFLTEENAQRIVDTLCKVRGAALKLGQMLSLQDETILSPELQRIFDRVRQAADFMPFSQTEKVLRIEWGPNWRDKFEFFEDKPFAAASIGQVHLGQLKGSGEKVAIKIQYPGVAQSIQSDIDNLMSILHLSNLLPKGLYVENTITVLKRELLDECDYVREAECYKKFTELLKNDPVFLIPKCFAEHTTKSILVTELIDGEPFDRCVDLPQDQRDFVSFLFFDFSNELIKHWFKIKLKI